MIRGGCGGFKSYYGPCGATDCPECRPDLCALTENLQQFELAWDELEGIPVNDNDEIEDQFIFADAVFEEGTSKFKIWKWLEDKFGVEVKDYVN